MKKFLILGIALFAILIAYSCSDEEETTDSPDTNGPSDVKMTILQFPHLDGYGTEVMREMPILFEYRTRDFVKYQVAFISCTCRRPVVNYWSVAYYEVNLSDGRVRTLSFSSDGDDGDYTAGMWGDSDPIPTGNNKTYEDFKEEFFPWLIGQNLSDLEGINIFYNEAPERYEDHANTKEIDAEHEWLIDEYAGASVSTHSFIRVTKALLEYHEEKYMD